jgi:cardiolipin synthase
MPTGSAPPAGEDRVLTLPNAVTAVRLACIPVFVVLLASGHRARWFDAAVLLAALGATDWVDGFLARRLRQVSTVGKVLDPVADRLLLATAVLAGIAVGAVPVVVAVLALVREAAVASGFLVVAAGGGRRMDVALPGKAGTLGLMVALPLFLAGHPTVGWHRSALVAAWAFAVFGLALGWYAAATYVPAALRALAEGRAARRARSA